MRKILSIVLCLTMLMTSFITTATAAGSPTIKCSDVTCEPGNTITVEVTVENNPGFCYLDMTPECSEGLTISKPTNGELISDFTKGKQYVWVADEDMTDNGVLMTLTLVVADTAAAGEYSVDFTIRTCANYDEQRVSFTVVPATITVKGADVAVTGISLSSENASVKTGETTTLTATVAPENATNQNVTWTSSDNTVATVANGVVTGVKKGTAVITATTEDGSFAASCTVTVNCAHKNTTVHPAEASTCQKQGHAEYTTCDDCGAVISGSDALLPLAGHNYSEIVKDENLKSAANCQFPAVYYKSCSVCGAKDSATFNYGDVDKTNHIGGTYIVNQKEATCYEEGYTGDTYCKGCDTKLETGTVIGKNAHNPASVWSTDEEYHWKECQTIGCGNIIDKAAHKGGEATCVSPAVCEVCGVKYGAIDPANHVHTEIRDQKAATEDEEGYTGDTWCLDCEQKIAAGEPIKKLDHVHNMTATAEKNSTCTEEGNIAYWHCEKCGKYYTDPDGIHEITFEETVIPMKAHSFTVLQFNETEHWFKCVTCDAVEGKEAHFGGTATCKDKAVCTVCEQAYGELTAHNYTENAEAAYLVSEATCVAPAVYHKSCSVCGVTNEETFAFGGVDKDNHVEGRYTDRQKDATCYAEGYTGDIYCEGCDALIEEGTIIAKTAHNLTENWMTDETSHWKVCQNEDCGAIVDKAEHTGGEATCISKAVCEVCGESYGAIDPENHVHTELRNEKPATEDEEGYTGDLWCLECETKLADGEIIKKLDHTHRMTATAAKESTCTEEGHTAYWHCEKCGKNYSDADGVHEITLEETVTAKKDHSFTVLQHNDTEHWYKCSTCDATDAHEDHKGGEATCIEEAVCEVCGAYYGKLDPDNHKHISIINVKDPTCTEAGNTGDTYCEDCKKIIADGDTIDTTEHTPSEDWMNDENEHWKICTVEGCEAEIEGSRAKHTESDWIVDKAATETEEGARHKECTVCGKVLKTETIPANGKTPESPQTGDNSIVILCVMAMTLALAGVVTVTVSSKKRKVR